MKLSTKSIILLSLIGLSSFLVYPTIQGIWSIAYIPPPEVISKNTVALCAWLTVFVAIGSLFCALTLSFPLGFFAKERPIFIGRILALIICVLNIFYVWNNALYQFSWFMGFIKTGEYSALIVASIWFAKKGCRFATSKKTEAAA
jgi:hypothetical protein